jgi:hypothetical protein
MSGTLGIRTKHRRHVSVSGGFDQGEAEDLAAAIAELGGWEEGPTIVDLLPELEERFLPGTPVWLGHRVYWRRGQRGTVTAGTPAEYSRWSLGDLSPWFIGGDGAEVFVTLDDGYASWWPARWLETR